MLMSLRRHFNLLQSPPIKTACSTIRLFNGAGRRLLLVAGNSIENLVFQWRSIIAEGKKDTEQRLSLDQLR